MKEDFSKTYTPFGIKKKEEVTDLLLFFAKVDELQMLAKKELELIHLGIYNLITAMYKKDVLEKFKGLNEKIKKEIGEMEKKIIMDSFVDFSRANKEIKELNLLRIRMREAEALLYKVIKEFGKEEYMILAEFLNLASKYVFYYILKKYKNLPKWRPKDVEFK